MSKSVHTRRYGLSSGVALAQALSSAGLFVFHTDDARRLAPPGVSPARVPCLLKALADAGWLVRLRRGLYAGTGRLPGGVDVPAPVIATALVSPSCIGLLSALAHHDLTDQVPRVVTVLTPRKVVTPSMRGARSESGVDRHTWRVADIDCRFVTLRADRYDIGLQRAWADSRFAYVVTDRERTVLDLFALPRHFGGVGEGLSVLSRSLESLDLERLIRYVLTYDSVTVAKRLGWSLERSGVGAGELARLLEMPAHSYVLLDPGRPRRGHHDRRWRVIVNTPDGSR